MNDEGERPPGSAPDTRRDRRNRLAGRVLLIGLALLLAAYLLPMAIR